jgi:hyperosmotically inducible periplasmic protein
MTFHLARFAGKAVQAGLIFSSTFLLIVAPPLFASAKPAAAAIAQAESSADSQIQADVTKALDNKRFADVKALAANGVVTLTGTVGIFNDKLEAERKIQHRKGVQGVRNLITVAGPVVEDATLRDKLAKKIAYDRVGYGTTPFNAITVAVQNGVVTVGGVACQPVDKASALGLVEDYPGVKDVIDQVQVAPLSPMDDRIRRDELRSIYSFPTLSGFAMDPVKPIRIVVINGNVTLVGTVDTEAQKDAAGLRANGVPGVFKVVNNLQVAQAAK